MGQITQETFDTEAEALIVAAEDLAAAIGTLPSPGTAPSEQETSNARASGRDVVHKVDRFTDHITPGTIDQATYDAETTILLAASASLQKAENDLQDSYTEFTSAANTIINNLGGLAQYMTVPPEGAGDPQRSKSKRSKESEAGYRALDKSRHEDKEMAERAMAKARHAGDKREAKEGKRFKGFFRK